MFFCNKAMGSCLFLFNFAAMKRKIGAMNYPCKKVISALLLGAGLVAAQSAFSEEGWFGGISALPFALAPGLGGTVEDPNHLNAGSYVGRAQSSSFILGGTKALPVSSRWSVTGSMVGLRGGTNLTSGMRLTNNEGGLSYNQLGLGLRYGVNRNLMIQGGMDRYRLTAGGRLNGATDVDLLSIGIKYGF